MTSDALDSLLRNTSLSRRVRTLVRFHFLMATALCFLVVAHFGRCFNTTANMRRCLFYRKSCFRHSFKATANRSVMYTRRDDSVPTRILCQEYAELSRLAQLPVGYPSHIMCGNRTRTCTGFISPPVCTTGASANFAIPRINNIRPLSSSFAIKKRF